MRSGAKVCQRQEGEEEEEDVVDEASVERGLGKTPSRTSQFNTRAMRTGLVKSRARRAGAKNRCLKNRCLKNRCREDRCREVWRWEGCS